VEHTVYYGEILEEEVTFWFGRQATNTVADAQLQTAHEFGGGFLTGKRYCVNTAVTPGNEKEKVVMIHFTRFVYLLIMIINFFGMQVSGS
jgi:hypothetical protein